MNLAARSDACKEEPPPALLHATAIKALIKPVPQGAVTASLLLIHLHLVHQKTDL